MANAVSIITTALNLFQPDKSVWVGGGASVLVVALGAVLVALGVAIPPIGILGLTTATPLTMGMFTALAIPVGHLVTSLVPATRKQQIDALAVKIGVDAEHLKSFIPQVVASFPPQTKDQAVAQAAVSPPNDSFNQAPKG